VAFDRTQLAALAGRQLDVERLDQDVDQILLDGEEVLLLAVHLLARGHLAGPSLGTKHQRSKTA
jgi:hypothetical protein